jgi:hypothetical protein
VRTFVAEHCGLVAADRARCHCRKRVPAAIALGRVDPADADEPSPDDIAAAVAEMEALYDAAGLLRSVPDAPAPAAVAAHIRSLLDSGGHRLVEPPP